MPATRSENVIVTTPTPPVVIGASGTPVMLATVGTSVSGASRLSE